MNKYLGEFLSLTQDDWVDWLPPAEFSKNNQINETTGVSIFLADCGYKPWIGIELLEPKLPNLSDTAKKEYFRADILADRFDRILAKLKALTSQSQDKYEEYANSRRSKAPVYKVGNKVIICLKNHKTNRPKKKCDDKWDGPYKVLKMFYGAVVVELPSHIPVNNNFILHWFDHG